MPPDARIPVPPLWLVFIIPPAETSQENFFKKTQYDWQNKKIFSYFAGIAYCAFTEKLGSIDAKKTSRRERIRFELLRGIPLCHDEAWLRRGRVGAMVYWTDGRRFEAFLQCSDTPTLQLVLPWIRQEIGVWKGCSYVRARLDMVIPEKIWMNSSGSMAVSQCFWH